MADAPDRPSLAWARDQVSAARTRMGLDEDPSGTLRAVSTAVQAETGLDAAVVVTTADGDVVYATGSGPAPEALAECERTAGEGPVRTAVRYRRPTMAGDLASDGVPRWTGYTDSARALGVQAVFALPLAVGAAVFGALQMSSPESLNLDSRVLRQALLLAHVAAESLLDDLDARGPASLLAGDDLAASMEVYQAQGMVMVALETDLDDAMARMRAHAFGADMALKDLAHAIIAGRIRLES